MSFFGQYAVEKVDIAAGDDFGVETGADVFVELLAGDVGVVNGPHYAFGHAYGIFVSGDVSGLEVLDDVALAPTVESDGDCTGGLPFDDGAGEGFVERGREDDTGRGVEVAQDAEVGYVAEVLVGKAEAVEARGVFD